MVVIGVGNEYRHDDGAGLAVVARLRDRVPPGVEIVLTDAATLDVSFEVALARLAALTGSGALTQVSADACAALFQLVGVYRVGPGEDGHRTVAVPLGGFLDRIAETITQPGAAAS